MLAIMPTYLYTLNATAFSSMKQRMRDSLCFRVNDQTREAIERLSTLERVTIAEIARDLLIEGLRARGEAV